MRFSRKSQKIPNDGIFKVYSSRKNNKKVLNYTCISPENHKEVQDVDKSMCALLVKNHKKGLFTHFLFRKYYKGVQIVDFLCMLF